MRARLIFLLTIASSPAAQAFQLPHGSRVTLSPPRSFGPPSVPPQCSKPERTTPTSCWLFGTKRRRDDAHGVRASGGGNGRSALRASTPDGSNAVDAEIADASSESSSSTSFLRAVDNFGMKLKPWALNAYDNSLDYYSSSKSDVNGTDTNTTIATANGGNWNVNRAKSILCKMQANILWILYIIYRGYRGFFVILPAVFREVFRQLEESDLVVDVYGDEEDEANDGAASPQQKEPMRLRTRVTISVLSGMLTLSYVVSGLLRVIGKFIKTFTNTTSVESSFEAAAEEVGVNEDKLRSKLK